MTIGEKIKKRRLELGLTLEKVGNAVGAHKSTVKRWEDGNIQTLGMDKLVPLSHVLLVDLSYLLGLTEDPGEQIPNTLQLACADLTPTEAIEVLNYIGYIKSRRKNK